MKVLLPAFLCLLIPLPGHAATAVQYAGKVSGDEVTGWRNGEVVKTQDKDGDNQYGSTGAVIWTIGSVREGTDPGWGFGGGAGGADIAQVGGGLEIDNLNADGTISAGAQTGGFRFRMTGAAAGTTYFGKSVRVGIMLDVLEASVAHPQTIQITSQDGAVDSTVIPVDAADGVPDLYFFDIVSPLPGENFDITVVAVDGEGTDLNAGIGPVSWDLYDTPADGVPPVIGTQPTGQTVIEGGRVFFSVLAAPLEGLTWQWRRNGEPIAGATGAVYVLDPVTAAAAGAYTCALANPAGNLISDPAELIVVPAAARSADYKAAVTAEASLLAYFPVDGSTAPDVLNTKNAAAGGTLNGTATVSSVPEQVVGNRGLLTGAGGLLTLAKDPAWDFADDNSGTIEAFLYVAATAGYNPAWFAVRDEGEVRYSLHTAGDGKQLILWNGSAATFWSYPAELLEKLSHVAVVFDAGTVTVFVNGQSLGTKEAELGFGVDLPAQAGASTPGGNEAFPGTIDELAIYSAPLSAQTIAAHYKAWSGVDPVPPQIIDQPQSVTVVENGAALFSVATNVPGSDTYQWQRNGVNIAGATSAELLIIPATAADAGAVFRCLVTNLFGATTSEGATLTTAPPEARSAAYQTAVRAEPSLLAYFPADGSTAPVLKNEKAAEFGGEYANGAVPSSVVGQTVGTIAVNAGARGAVLLTKDPAWDFADDNSGAVEAFVFQEEGAGYNPAWFAVRDQNGVRYSLHLDSAGANLWIWNGSAAISYPTPESTIGRLCHVAVVFHQDTEAGIDTAALYLNGELIGLNESYSLGGGLDLSAQIGAAQPDFIEAFPGTIDELAIYSEPLTAEQIAAHYAAWTGGGGGASTAPQIITSLTQSPVSGVSLTFNTATGPSYRVFSSLDLTAWTPVGAAQTGDGNPLTVTDPAATSGKKFYRVQITPVP